MPNPNLPDFTPSPPNQTEGTTSRLKILNWEDSGTPIDDDTYLTRYMKLSTFLLLLDDKLFIPTIRLLQAGDSLESRIPEKLLHPTYWRKMGVIVEPHEPLLLRTAHGSKWLRVEGSEHNDSTLSFLAKRWLEELARRRCAWCWNQSTENLYALWKLYGERGVAVMTTVGNIRTVLEKAGAREGIVSPVKYMPLGTPSRPEHVSTWLAMERPENLVRPYLFKDAGYRIEEEVRFVLYANPLVTTDLGGLLLNVDAKALISVFKVSPDLPATERNCIERLAHERLQFQTLPPSPWAEEESEFSILKPFTKEVDDFRDVFTDLA